MEIRVHFLDLSAKRNWRNPLSSVVNNLLSHLLVDKTCAFIPTYC